MSGESDYIRPVSCNAERIYKIKMAQPQCALTKRLSPIKLDKESYIYTHRYSTPYSFSATPMIVAFDSAEKGGNYEGIYFESVFFFVVEALVDISFYCVFMLCGLFLGETMCVQDIKNRVL